MAQSATVTLSDSNLIAGETATVTIVFTEQVSAFDNSDFSSIPNGALTAVATGDNITWTATYTPNAATTDATNTIDLDLTGVTFDISMVPGGGTVSSANFTIDTDPPTVAITVADNSLLAGETSLVTFVFSEAVTGFTNADLTVENGTLTAVATGDNITFTATLTPAVSTTDPTNVITVDNTAYTDVPGNPGSGSTASNNYAVSTVRPTATVVVADTSLIAGETSLVTFTFSEAVGGFTNTDLTIPNGALSAVSSGDGGITWTATFTPTASITDSTNVIAIAMAGVSSIATTNAGTGTTNSNNFTIDTLRPTVAISVLDTAILAGETSPVTFTFSEQVTGFSNADLSVQNGTLTAVQTANNITWTATFTPTANLEDLTNIISIDVSALTDLPGNAGVGSISSNNYQIDTLIPTVAISTQLTSPTAVSPLTFAITFSETVTGLAMSDFTVGNGAVISLTGSGTTYSIEVTPDANGLITVDLPAASANDTLGNGNAAATTLSITFDNTLPATISIESGVRYKPINFLSGTGIPDSQVEVFDNDVLIGTVTSASNGDWTLSVVPPLIFGEHSIVASGVNGLISEPASVSIFQSPLDADGDGASDVNLFRKGTCSYAFSSTGTVSKFVSKLGGRRSYGISADYDGDGLSECSALSIARNKLKWSFYDADTQLTTSERFGRETDYVLTGCNFDGGREKEMATIRRSSLYVKHRGEKDTVRFKLPLKLDGSKVRGCGDVNQDGVDELLFKIPITHNDSTQYNIVAIDTGGRIITTLENVGDFDRAYIADATGDLQQDFLLSFTKGSRKNVSIWEIDADSETSKIEGLSSDFAIGNCIDDSGIYGTCIQYQSRSKELIQQFLSTGEAITTSVRPPRNQISDPYQLINSDTH